MLKIISKNKAALKELIATPVGTGFRTVIKNEYLKVDPCYLYLYFFMNNDIIYLNKKIMRK